jgi:hypothetical protein
MKTLPLYVLAVMSVGAGIAVFQGCSSSSSSTPAADAGDEEGPRVIACPNPTDAGAAAAADAGMIVTIISPTEGQKFNSTDTIPFKGTGRDLKEGEITDKTRTIWYIGQLGAGINPDGESPEDTHDLSKNPLAPGSYIIRFAVSTTTCVTGEAAVNIAIE